MATLVGRMRANKPQSAATPANPDRFTWWGLYFDKERVHLYSLQPSRKGVRKEMASSGLLSATAKVEVRFPGTRFRSIALDLWRAECRTWAPQHCLDIPPEVHSCNEEFRTLTESQTRRQAFAETAEYNRDLLANGVGDDWAGVIEIGLFDGPGLCSYNLDDDDRGEFRQHSNFPIRLVRPTAEEITRFATKGGAA